MNNNYVLVWSDEFSSNSLDTAKWSFEDRIAPNSDMITSDTADVAQVLTNENGTGMLHLRAYKTGNGTFKTTKSITTSNTMDYLYGYLEMRARVPIGQGVWPSLWLTSNTRNYNTLTVGGVPVHKMYGYKIEIDMFEVFSDAKVLPNIHKWWKEGTDVYNELIAIGSTQNEQYNSIFDDTKTFDISDGCWHTYGMLWTSDEISMYVDGVKYQTFDLNKNFGHGDMAGFKQPLSIIINNHLFTEGYFNNGANGWAEKFKVDSNNFKEAVYDIDYIRLYQKPDTGKIYYF